MKINHIELIQTIYHLSKANFGAIVHVGPCTVGVLNLIGREIRKCLLEKNVLLRMCVEEVSE
jgi:hypothetical protein